MVLLRTVKDQPSSLLKRDCDMKMYTEHSSQVNLSTLIGIGINEFPALIVVIDIEHLWLDSSVMCRIYFLSENIILSYQSGLPGK